MFNLFGEHLKCKRLQNRKKFIEWIIPYIRLLSEGATKMKIMLLNPPYKVGMIKEGRCQQRTLPFQSTYPPLTLANLAAILKKRHKVILIDCIAENINPEKLQKICEDEKPDIIFINTSTPTIDSDIETAKILWMINKPKIYLFGVHVTFFKNKFRNRYFKVINGPPEKFAFNLVGKKYSFKRIPSPDWSSINLTRYRIPFKSKPFTLIKPSSGCPYECIFCTSPFYYGKNVLFRPIDKVIEEIRYDLSLNIKDFLFFSETFTINKEYVKALCKAIVKNNLDISWVANSRTDTIDYKTLKIMKEAGCWMISFGIESSDENLLRLSKKTITKKQIIKAIRLTNQLGIFSFGHFIFGLPGETRESIINTIKFSKKLGLDFAAFYIATPFPGSKLYKIVKKEHRWEDFDYSLNIINPKLNLKFWRIYAYLSFYLNWIMKPSKLLKFVRLFV